MRDESTDLKYNVGDGATRSNTEYIQALKPVEDIKGTFFDRVREKTAPLRKRVTQLFSAAAIVVSSHQVASALQEQQVDPTLLSKDLQAKPVRTISGDEIPTYRPNVPGGDGGDGPLPFDPNRLNLGLTNTETEQGDSTNPFDSLQDLTEDIQTSDMGGFNIAGRIDSEGNLVVNAATVSESLSQQAELFQENSSDADGEIKTLLQSKDGTSTGWYDAGAPFDGKGLNAGDAAAAKVWDAEELNGNNPGGIFTETAAGEKLNQTVGSFEDLQTNMENILKQTERGQSMSDSDIKAEVQAAIENRLGIQILDQDENGKINKAKATVEYNAGGSAGYMQVELNDEVSKDAQTTAKQNVDTAVKIIALVKEDGSVEWGLSSQNVTGDPMHPDTNEALSRITVQDNNQQDVASTDGNFFKEMPKSGTSDIPRDIPSAVNSGIDSGGGIDEGGDDGKPNIPSVPREKKPLLDPEKGRVKLPPEDPDKPLLPVKDGPIKESTDETGKPLLPVKLQDDKEELPVDPRIIKAMEQTKPVDVKIQYPVDTQDQKSNVLQTKQVIEKSNNSGNVQAQEPQAAEVVKTEEPATESVTIK